MVSDTLAHTTGVTGPALDEATQLPHAFHPPFWRDAFFWLALCLTIFAIAPFLLPGYFWGANDARHHVYFLFEFDRSVQDGIWWPRWSPDFAFGYGYPFFNVYGPFSHLVAELLLHFLKFSHTGAIETVFGLSIVGSAATMYLYVRSWMGRAAALVSALAYVYIPYHLLNLYVRANLAESVAFVWLPLCLWGARQTVLQPRFGWVALLAISYAGLILTSNLLWVLFTPLLGAYLLVLVLVYNRPKLGEDGMLGRIHLVATWLRTATVPVVGICAGLGLSAIFLFPMLVENQYVRVDQWFDGRYDFHGHFVHFFQLFSPAWGFGISQIGPNDLIGFQLGAVITLLALVGTILVWPLARQEQWEIGCFLLAALVATMLALTWAAPLWDLPLISTVLRSAQFPWRWFSITALCLSILSGLVMDGRLTPRTGQITLPLLLVIALILLGSYPYLQVEIKEPAEGPISLAALMRFQQSSDEMTGSTAWTEKIPTWSPIADEYIRQEETGERVTPVTSLVDYSTVDYKKLVVDKVAHNTIMEEVWFCTDVNKKAKRCSPRTDQRIIFNQFYYPGWRAYLLDGKHGNPVKELEIIPELEGTLGRMTVAVPPVGEGYLLLRLEDTLPRIAGKYVSMATGVCLLMGALWSSRRKLMIFTNRT